MLPLLLAVSALYRQQRIIPYRPDNSLISPQVSGTETHLAPDDILDITAILHHIDRIPYVPHTEHDSHVAIKDPNQICGLNHHMVENAKHGIKSHSCHGPERTLPSFLHDVKKVRRLKTQIRRTGLVLARHAEENALSKYHDGIGIKGRKGVARRKLHMVVIRVNSVGDITESKPCSHCVDVMRSYGIRKVTYSTRDGTLTTESIALIESQPSVGYRSVDRALNILDEMLRVYSTGT